MASIYHYFEKSAKIYPNSPAYQQIINDTPTTWTYRTVEQWALGAAEFLKQNGIKQDDRVMIYSKNRVEWVVAALGSFLVGATVAPVDSQLKASELVNLMNHSEAKLIFTCNETKEAAQIASDEAKRRPRVVVFDESVFLALQQGADRSQFKEPSEEALALIVYTSGTTGEPKGVTLTHRNICHVAFALKDSELVNERSKILSMLPLHHIYPFMATFIAPLFTGAAVVFQDSLKGADMLQNIRNFAITIFIGVPQVFAMLSVAMYREIEKNRLYPLLKRLIQLSEHLRTTREINIGKTVFASIHKKFGPDFAFFASGGAKLDPEAARKLVALGFTIIEGYGLSETAAIVALNPLSKQKIGSVGKALSGVEIQIIDKDQDGIGEIAVRGPSVMNGYYQNEAATKAAFQDGWFLTGDLGYFDQDDYLFITGRRKEVIVLASGKNIYPDEIEKHYLQSPYIKELCVSTVQSGKLHALIVPDMERIKQDGIGNINEIIRWEIKTLSSQLSPYKRIKGYRLSQEPLPRTPIGKIKRFKVAETLSMPERLAGLSDADAQHAALLETRSGKSVVDYIQKVSEKEHIPLDASLELDLGMDSLQTVEMLAAFESLFSIAFPDDFGKRPLTVRDIIEFIEQAKPMETQSTESAIIKNWADIIAAPLSKDDESKIPPPRTPLSQASFRIFSVMLKGFLIAFSQLEIIGLQNLPPQGPYIIAPNHVSYVDGFFVASALPLAIRETLYFIGLEKIFKKPYLSPFTQFINVIPINPEANVHQAMHVSGRLLKNGAVFCIFPEGGRTFDGQLMEFKKGVAILSLELNAPVVPTYLDGLYHVMPRGTTIPKPHKVKVRFGKPVYPEQVDFTQKPKGIDNYQWFMTIVKERILELGAESGNE